MSECTLEELFPPTGSPSFPLTVALLSVPPSLIAVTLIVTLAVPPTEREPTAQFTLPEACEQLPCELDTDWYATYPVGSGSVAVTPVAGEGPLFRIARV